VKCQNSQNDAHLEKCKKSDKAYSDVKL